MALILVRREFEKLFGLVEPFSRNISCIFELMSLGFLENRELPKNSRDEKPKKKALIL